ncbi:hypothetical protein DXG01_012206 [Tephrocybe rancida]|nr:hypothetical protein DXG01_012206 [Tephrocybe rancida]
MSRLERTWTISSHFTSTEPPWDPHPPHIWKTSQKFSTSLNPNSNLFAVRATNPGLLAAVQITFSEGTTAIITSDTSWRSIKTIPSNFQSPSLDGSSWTAATVSTPSGKTLQSALILLTVDDGFTLYVNGALVGSSPNQTDVWKSAQRFTVPLSGTSPTLFAVRATNLPGVTTGGQSPAGLLAAIKFTYTDGTTTVVLSDATWKVTSAIPAGFELPSTNDSSWSTAKPLGLYGVSPLDTQVTISNALGEDPAPLLRKEFSTTKTISFARLYYSAGGYAIITLNGAAASDHVLTPGFTKYDVQMQYVVLDVATKLKTGTNAIGVELGRSHYGATLGSVWNWNSAPWHASYLQLGFDTPGFAATGWSLVPVSITQPVSGVYIAAFERIVSGWAKIRVTGPAKTLITIHFGEKLNANRFWLAGSGKSETFEPTFSYKGYQYVQLEGWPAASPPSAADIAGQVVHDDLPSRGGFASSSDLLNKMHTAAHSRRLPYLKMLSTMSQIATVLGKSADATSFNSQAANVKVAFNNAFLSPSNGFYVGVGDSGYRQTHNLLAIAFGLAPNSTTAQNAADSIARDVASRGNHLNTGALGTKYILPVLTDYQHGDAAFAVAQQTTFPSWGYWISNGANTMVRL